MRHLLIFMALLCCATAAEAKPNQSSGEIHFEKDPGKVSAFPMMQDGVIDYFKHLDTIAQQAGTGSVPPAAAALSDDMITYLNSVYLYCSIKKGTCPTILDALLEVDVINARLSKQPVCPALKKFWTQWVRSDMEKRQQFQVQTGFLTDTENFRKNIRPKYIRCDDTVKAAIQGFGTDSEFFKNRYGGDSPQKASIAASVQLLEQIKAKVPNIISEEGAR